MTKATQNKLLRAAAATAEAEGKKTQTPEQLSQARAVDNAISTILGVVMSEEGADARFVAGGISMAFARFLIQHLIENPSVRDVNTMALRSVNASASALLTKPEKLDG